MSAGREHAPLRVWVYGALAGVGIVLVIGYVSAWARLQLPLVRPAVQTSGRIECPPFAETEMLLITVTRRELEVFTSCTLVGARGTYTRSARR